MITQDYHKSIIAAVSAEEAFNKISSVRSWWIPDIKGSTNHLNDVFIMTTGADRTSVTMQVVEVVPNKKLVWLVTDCYLHWIKDTTEWKNTRIVFEISEGKEQTRIDMTHIGVAPGVECYDDCEDGWNRHLNKLATWLETGIAPLA